MSNFEIEKHSIVYPENKKKSKLNSFCVFKLTNKNNINLQNKTIVTSKKNNYIVLNDDDAIYLNDINNSIKDELENYIYKSDFTVKNNISKIMFNDISQNNKLFFDISKNISTSQILKNTYYNCIINIKYIYAKFTSNKVCEISVILELSSFNTITENNKSNDESSSKNTNDTSNNTNDNTNNDTNNNIDDNVSDEKIIEKIIEEPIVKVPKKRGRKPSIKK